MSLDLDRARVIPTINCRMGRAGTIKFVFTSGGNPYPIDGFDFESFAQKGSGPKLLNFTIGDGLTIGGASLNELTVDFTAANTNKIGPGQYVWQLVNLTRDETWINTDFNIHTGKFDASSDVEESISITLGDTVVNVDITLGAGEAHFLGKYASLAALETAHATAEDGDYAMVDSGAGNDVQQYIWDEEDGWVQGGGNPGGLDAHINNTNNPHQVTKAQVGLSAVDNTSDANKPVSTAQAAALALKANLASPAFTGTPTAPTPSASDDSTKLATTAYVKDVVEGISGSVTAEDQTAIRKLQYSFNNPLYSDKLWEAYESDAITLDTTDTDAVMSMVDKAGGGNAFVAASATSAPTLNGNALEFDGLDDRLAHNNPAELPRTTGGEVMAVVYLDPAAGNYYTVLNIGKSGSTSVRRNYLSLYIDELGRPRISYGNESTTVFIDTVYLNQDKLITPGYRVISWSADGSAYKIYLDGIEQEVTVSGTNHGTWVGGHSNQALIDSVHIGYRYNQYRATKMKSLYIFSDVLTDDERREYVKTIKERYKLDPFHGMKLVSYGDSITAIGVWQKYVCERLGFLHVNRGIGGTQVKETGSIAYVDAEGGLLSTSIADGGSGPPSGTEGVDYFEILSSMCNQERIDTIPLDAEVILILGGPNDGGSSGAIGDAVDVNLNTSFYAAYKTMLNRIYARCPNALIVLLTPPYHATADAVGTFSEGTGYDSLRTAIRAIGYRYGYPVIALKEKAQINANNYATYLSDQVHPNDAGGKKIAAVVAHELNVIKPFS